MAPPNPANTAVAARIVQARTVAGFATLDAAAITLGVDGQIYERHESGSYRPKPAELRRYAEAFDVSIGWLSTGVGQGPREGTAAVVVTSKEMIAHTHGGA